MNIIRKGFLITATAVTLAFGAAGSAQAHAFADAILEINNLRFLNSGGTQYTPADFSTLEINNSRLATAFVSSLPPLQSNTAGAICVGTCPLPAPNTPLTPRFDPLAVSPPAVLTTFGYGDTELLGSALEPGGANAATRATASVGTSPNTASGTANTGTVTSFEFSLGSADSITVEFDAEAYTIAHVPLTAGADSVASARLSWSINIIDLETGENVLSYSPDEINGDSLRSRTHVLPGEDPYNFAGFLTATSDLLEAGTIYQLTISHASFADALQEEVPEPATLAILAAGLLSMSLVSRRRKS
ncbi:PEP-CTERM sorting domain-containing protein [Massilia dura]|uniref:PEP-CTERM sorting domain-containing protein n=1 Tax=Pseudoduganella dura TaxID=321982 RepID=A0A6I3XWX6_9BURK|nr:EDSAP-1 family PEP-CTERM protein [Pseudoduganella dura]MUI16255.1 PEP-CTERM sorting domain-containing protein [Pseudoduganella dura]GGY05180.1 hypothetical protein GCM10007386_39820 [Pseudoduganella dura]